MRPFLWSPFPPRAARGAATAALVLVSRLAAAAPATTPARDAGATPPVSASAATAGAPVPPSESTSAPAPPPLRSAAEILADSIKATGGDAPWKAHRSIETTTQMEYAKMAISGIRKQTLTSHNKSLAVTSIPNVGEMKEGSNGRVVWAEDPVNGLRVLEGAESAQFLPESTWNLERNIKKVFAKIAVKSDSDGGRALECLDLTPPAGHPLTVCYDPATHLQVLQKGIAATPQGDVPFTTRIKSWREAGGLKFPDAVEMSTGPIELSSHLTDVAFDKPVDDKMFEMPGGKGKGRRAVKPPEK